MREYELPSVDSVPWSSGVSYSTSKYFINYNFVRIDDTAWEIFSQLKEQPSSFLDNKDRRPPQKYP